MRVGPSGLGAFDVQGGREFGEEVARRREISRGRGRPRNAANGVGICPREAGDHRRVRRQPDDVASLLRGWLTERT